MDTLQNKENEMTIDQCNLVEKKYPFSKGLKNFYRKLDACTAPLMFENHDKHKDFIEIRENFVDMVYSSFNDDLLIEYIIGEPSFIGGISD